MTIPQYLEFSWAMVITVTFIWGLEYTFNDGEIFGKPGNWMRANFPEWVNKPLFDCKYCMSSVWGTLGFVFLLWGWPWYFWIVFCFCLCGLTSILDK